MVLVTYVQLVGTCDTISTLRASCIVAAFAPLPIMAVTEQPPMIATKLYF